MKNKRLRFYVGCFYFYSNIALFAQSGPGSNNTSIMYALEGDDEASPTMRTAEPSLPIDDYLWVLALIGSSYAFMKLRNYQNSRIQD